MLTLTPGPLCLPVQGRGVAATRVDDFFCLLFQLLQSMLLIQPCLSVPGSPEKFGALPQPPRSHLPPLPPVEHPPPFPFNPSAKIPPREQKITLIPDRGEKNGARLLQLGPTHGCKCTHEEGGSERRNLGILFLSPSLPCLVMTKQTLNSTAVLLTPRQTRSYNVSPPR